MESVPTTRAKPSAVVDTRGVQGEIFPNSSRFEPRNRSSRRKSAQTSRLFQMERTHFRCYEVYGEGERSVTIQKDQSLLTSAATKSE